MEYEDPDGYGPGGYHPVHLGDKLNNGRYVVVHKLGYGSYATVWLMQDLHQNRHVALKLVTADASSSSEEAKFLRFLNSQPKPKGFGFLSMFRRNKNPQLFPQSFFPALLDEFTLTGPNGTHLCLVTEPLGLNLSITLKHVKQLPLAVAKKVAVQMIQATVQMHGRGVVHGDLHRGNILFCLPGLETWTREQVNVKLGEPICSTGDSDTESSIVSDSDLSRTRDPSSPTPEYFVYPPSIEDMVPLCLVDDCSIRVVDFGEAFFSHSQGVQKQLATPPAVAAPEVLFEDVLTPASDIWALGCLIFNTICGHSLWSYLTSLDDVLIDITLAYGRLPERWWTKWEHREDYFEQDGQLKEDQVGKILTDCRDLETLIIKQLLEVRPDMEEEELDEFSRLMVAMMKLEPAERVTAEGALRLIPQAW